MRPAACAIMEGFKRVENRNTRLKNNDFNYIGLPIGIHVKKETKSEVLEDFKDGPKFKTELFTSKRYRGCTEDTFFSKTQCMNGKIIGAIIFDVWPDPDVTYPHYNYPIERKKHWYVQKVIPFKADEWISGFAGGQNWKFMRSSSIISRFIKQLPVKFHMSLLFCCLVQCLFMSPIGFSFHGFSLCFRFVHVSRVCLIMFIALFSRQSMRNQYRLWRRGEKRKQEKKK